MPDDPSGLKFDAESPTGLGDQFRERRPLGSGRFEKVQTGDRQTFALKLDDAGRDELRARIKASGAIRLLVVPTEPDVAATYFGAGEKETDRRPRLALGVAAR